MAHGFAVWSLLLALAAGADTAPARPAPAATSQRFAYVVRHGGGKDLAEALGKHFKGQAEVLLLARPHGDWLLVRAAPAVLDEVLKLLDRLDRRPHLVSVEVVLAEIVPPREPEGGKPAGPGPQALDARALAGPMDQVWGKVQALQKEGRLGRVRRLQLAALEGGQATALVGGSMPYTTGATRIPTGRTIRSIAYRAVGTMVQLTVRTAGPKDVVMDLDLDDAQGRSPESAPALTEGADGKAVRATEFITTKLRGRLRVPAGQAVLAEDVRTSSKSGRERTLIVVGARLLETQRGNGQ
jgi:type II secretory pathway component GspD/PulD (secretin)